MWLELSEKLSRAATSYSRVSHGPITASSQLDTMLITYLYTSCICRNVRLLFSVWEAKGWGVGAFNNLRRQNILVKPDESQKHHLTTTSGITRTQISMILAQAHGPFLLHLEPYDRIRLLRFMANIYSAIGFHRKEVYILRELLSTIMDTLVTSREETLKSPQSRRDEANGTSTFKESGNTAFRALESPQGNDSIIRLGKYICEVYGIDLTSVKLLGTSPGEAEQVKNDDSSGLSLLPYGWSDLQLGVIREAVAIAEALPGKVDLAGLFGAKLCLSI